MRARIVIALLVLFGLLCSAHSGAAQSRPIPSQARQLTTEKPPSAAKPLELSLATPIASLPRQAGSANDPTSTLQAPRTWTDMRQNREDGPAIFIMRSGGGPDAPSCAHIRIIEAPEMDLEMVVEALPGAGGPIQTFQGLPPCRRDLAPKTAQRFYGLPPKLPVRPRTPFVQPSVSHPSAQPQSLQPKTDAPAPKP